MAAAGAESRPIEPGSDDSGMHRTVHPGLEDNLAAGVEGANLVAIADAAGRGIGGMHLEISDPWFHLTYGWEVGERRVEMVVRLAGEKFERETGGFRSRSMARFSGRREGDDRIEPLTLQSFAVELGFAAGCREVAMGEGQEWGCCFWRAVLGWTDECVRPYLVRCAFEIQADAMLAFQPVSRDPFESRIGRLQRAVDHGIHRFAEAFVFKTHSFGDRAEPLDI